MLFDYAPLRFPMPIGGPTTQIIDYDPPRGYRPGKALPDISDITSYAYLHRAADYRIKRYLDAKQDNYIALASRARIEDLADDLGLFMQANNASARIAFAQIAVRHIERAARNWDGTMFLVTLVPGLCARNIGDDISRRQAINMTIRSRFRIEDPALRAENRQARLTDRLEGIALRKAGDAAQFDVKVLQAMARQALPGVPFIGMVEASVWRSWGRGYSWVMDVISWHCHLIVWGVSRDELERLLKPFRAKHAALGANSSAAHIKEVSMGDLTRQALYILKAPQKISEVKYREKEWRNSATGERLKVGWHVRKDWMSTGQRVRMLDIMGDRTLDQLIFGNNAGTPIVRDIRREAMAKRNEWLTLQERRYPGNYGRERSHGYRRH